MATAMKHDIPPQADAPREEKREGQRRRFIVPILALVALAGILWGVSKWNYGRTHESTDNAQVDGHIVPVIAKVGGYVTKVLVEDNQHVAAGALLVQIDTTDYQLRYEQADAELKAAQASAGGSGVAQGQVATAAGQRAALDAQIVAARANRDKALADLARFRDLAAQQIVSKQQLDAAQAAADAAVANLQAVERQAGAASATVSSAEAGVRLASARLQSAQVARDNALLQLQYTRITAPASGTVSKRQVEPGQLVQPGQPLLTIVDDTGAFVTANFKETQLADIRVGQPVEFTVDAYGDHEFAGKVLSIGAATGAKFALLPPDNATGNFTKVVQRIPVRIGAVQGADAQHPLRPGMSVEAHVKTR